ncbi:MAG: type II toxin-antitoxin system VapC family toxin [Dehalococcoidia bacterium]|nr:type II toxin-antitoxin system VapC family toxin [Dehalococcoidia bacterium]
MRVCVDASLAVMLLLPEPLSDRAKSLWRSWSDLGIDMVTAPLFFAEVTSVLREHVFFRRLDPEVAEDAFQAFREMDIATVYPPDLQPQAWAIAKKYNQRRTYDAQYLAVATALGCELWTGDRKLVNAVNEPWVRWVGDYQSGQKH